MKPFVPLAAALAAATLAAAATAAGPAVPPVAEKRDTTSTYHGTVVHDPYRWLENKKSPEAQAWFKGQAEAARSVLERIDGREAIAARLAELADAQGDSVRGLRQLPGERFYYLKREPGQKQFRLVMREGAAGAERVLVDPQTEMKRTGVPHAINHYQPSWDGRYLAYGLSAGGSENASLHVLEIATGRLVGTPVPRVQEAHLSWTPDSRSVLFNQLRELPAGAAETETYMDSAVMRLPVGGRPQPVFGPTVTRGLGLARLDVAQLTTVPGSRWVVARTTDTTVPEGKLFVLPLAQLGRPGAAWRLIGTPADKVVSIALQGDELLVMTQAGAPHRKIVAVDLRRGTLRDAKLRVAEPADGVLEGFESTPSGLVAEVRQGTQLRCRRGHGQPGQRPGPPHRGPGLQLQRLDRTLAPAAPGR